MAPRRQGESQTPSSDELAGHARAFRHRFGDGSDLRLFFSPGRVNLMGAHLDYNGGPVMPTAIDRGTFIAVRPRRDRRLRLASTLDAHILDLDLSSFEAARSRRWVDYPVGVIVELLASARASGLDARCVGIEMLFGGNLPIGAGLSSSASICVGTALALQSVWSRELSRMDLVHAALRAERDFVGVQCGIMDPYAVGLAREGHILWLDCKDSTSAYIPLDTERFTIAIADTLVRRELAQSSFNERVRQCQEAFHGLGPFQPGASCLRDIHLEVFEARRAELDPVAARRAEHVIHEVARTFAARDALLRDDPVGFGTQMTRAHASLRELFEVSAPELDQLVQSASECEGVLGTRLTGAGFGGCTVVLLEKGAEDDLCDRLTADFERRFGRKPFVGFFGGDSGPRELLGDWDRVSASRPVLGGS
jgi:galactokinase